MSIYTVKHYKRKNGISKHSKDLYLTILFLISVDLASQVREIISNTDLHRKVLLYEPIFVEDLHARLKANKIKCSFQALLDVLDDLVSAVVLYYYTFCCTV